MAHEYLTGFIFGEFPGHSVESSMLKLLTSFFDQELHHVGKSIISQETDYQLREAILHSDIFSYEVLLFPELTSSPNMESV